MLTSKKGISALQIHRMMGFGSYRTAWSMCHRVRAGLANEEFRKLMGVVEVDETFVGGDDNNRHFDKKKGSRGGKSIVIGAVQRKGNVVARVINRADWTTLEEFVRMAVSNKVSLLATDEHHGYRHLGEESHGRVKHSAKQYVMGAIHTNTIEGFWSILKRGIVGSFHKVSAKYLPLYVAEFQFRYNNRLNADILAQRLVSFRRDIATRPINSVVVRVSFFRCVINDAPCVDTEAAADLNFMAVSSYTILLSSTFILM